MVDVDRANLAFVGGVVFAAEGSGRPAGAVAIADGVIVAVGSVTDIEDLVGPGTEVVDLGDRMLLPGFQDAHVHPATSGLDLTRCALHEMSSADAAADAIGEYCVAHPDEPWVLGGGWAMDWYPGGTPTVEELDRLVPDRPAFLRNRDGHGAWVNSRALVLAGVAADTVDPGDGRIERRPDGSPQGTLQEGAMGLVERVLPAVTPSDYGRGIEASQDLLVGLGITAWQDAAVDADIHVAYRRLAGEGRLVVDVVGALWWERGRGLEQVEELLDLRSEGGPGYRPTTIKIMLDGVAENFTAAMLEPYLDRSGTPTAEAGLDFVDPAELGSIVTRLDAEGFQVHFHAVGDRAVRNALDAVAAAREANGPTDGRHHIAHIQLIHPDDLPRFRSLGVVANAQPYWACADGYQTDLTIPFIGTERAARQYPFASLMRFGATLAMGSDWSVSTPNPLLEIEVAVTRVLPERRGDEPFYPEERLPLPAAIGAFTAGSAFVNHRDADTGSIAVGKAADLVVLDRDPLAPGAGPVGDAVVDMTIIGGDVVHRREAAS